MQSRELHPGRHNWDRPHTFEAIVSLLSRANERGFEQAVAGFVEVRAVELGDASRLHLGRHRGPSRFATPPSQ